MKKSFGDYRLLAGNSGTRGSLWEGPDHLLYIESSGVLLPTKETYKRVDYSKIQTLGLGRTRSYFWTALWLIALLALCVWGGLAVTNTVGRAIFGSISVLLLVILIQHLVKGPTCVCKLQTSVQVLRLKPLARLRVATRCVARITELCQQAQGQVQVGELPPDPLAPVASERPHGVKLPFAGSAWLRWGMPLLLISGLLTAAEPFFPQVAFLLADLTAALVASLMVIIGLAVNHRYQMPGVLRGALWGSIANFLIGSILAYFFMIFAAMQETRDMLVTRGVSPENITVGIYGNLLVWMARAGFKEMGGFAWIFVVVGGLNVLFALLGLPSAWRARPAVSEAAPPPVLQPAANEPQTSQEQEP